MWRYIIGGFFIVGGAFVSIYTWVTRSDRSDWRIGVGMGLLCIVFGVLAMIANDPFEQ